MKKIILLLTLSTIVLFNSFAQAEIIRFVDFTKVLNSSKAGAQAQSSLKNDFEKESKNFTKQETDIRKEESTIISQKNALTSSEYQKKVEVLRKKVADLQKNKRDSFNRIAKSRTKAKRTLLKAVQPIIKKYMEDNKITLVLSKKSVLMGDVNLEITDQIISILNKELSSIKIN